MEQLAFSLCRPRGGQVICVSAIVGVNAWKEEIEPNLIQSNKVDFYNQTRTTRGGERKRKSIQLSFFIQSTVPPTSPTRSFSPIKVNLLGHSCQGNPGLPWRRLGSRCRATYTTNRCIMGEQLRAGEDTASAALPLAEPLPSSKPFLLFHSPTCRPPNPPPHALPNAPHTLSVLVWVPSRFTAWRCGRTGRHSAPLRVQCSLSAARVFVSPTWMYARTANATRESDVLCFSVFVHFSGSVCFN